MTFFLSYKKSILAIIIFLLLLIAGFFYIKSHRKPTMMMDDVILVEATKVKQGAITVEAQAIGTLIAAKTVPLTPEIAGHVAKILFQDGSFVKAGTPLIQLDDAVYRAKLESAKANLRFSEANYNRMVLLGKQGAISKQAIEQAQADLQEKRAAEEESQVSVDKMTLTAPFDGMLGQAKVNPGNYVQVGQELVTITDIHHLRVQYSVAEKYLPQLKLGQAVKLTSSAYPDKEFVGTVAFISPTIDVNNRTISLYAEVDNSQGLLTSGLFVDVTHQLGTIPNGLIIPVTSLVPTIDGQEVYKIINNKVMPVSVTIGQRTQNSAQVVSGLNPGDFIVTAGQDKLKQGTSVKVKS
jgi:membrane fusion protein (multidrug efflux system)